MLQKNIYFVASVLHQQLSIGGVFVDEEHLQRATNLKMVTLQSHF